MTTEAQLYLNEQTTERRFAEELAAKDREIAALREALKGCRGLVCALTGADDEIANVAIREADAALSGSPAPKKWVDDSNAHAAIAEVLDGSPMWPDPAEAMRAKPLDDAGLLGAKAAGDKRVSSLFGFSWANVRAALKSGS
jgi:hypothetical protein